jgi:hypothetical protein
MFIFVSFFSDPFSMAPPKALENIGKTLHSQYERWQPKVRNLLSCLTYVVFLILMLIVCDCLALNPNVTCRLVTSFS